MTTRTIHGTSRTRVRPRTETGDIFLGWVPSDQIPAGHRAFVERHVKRAARKLRLARVPRVRYFAEPSLGREIFTHTIRVDRPPAPGYGVLLAGLTPFDLPWTIGIDANLRGTEAVKVVLAHEVRHCAQLWGRADVPEADREADAERFAIDYLEAG